MTTRTVTVHFTDFELVNPLNERCHWGTRARRIRAQLRRLEDALRGAVPPAGPPWRVTITRHGPRLLDDDGAIASAKHIRDGVAHWLGVDDGRVDLVTFAVSQDVWEHLRTRRVPGRLELREVPDYGVTVEICAGGPC